jgi:hypothetical protein
MLAAVVLFSGMDASSNMPPRIIRPADYLSAITAFVPVIISRQAGGLSALRTRRPRDHILRGIVGVTAMGLVFTAFKLLPLGGR